VRNSIIIIIIIIIKLSAPSSPSPKPGSGSIFQLAAALSHSYFFKEFLNISS
jgi:hypothetical protein